MDNIEYDGILLVDAADDPRISEEEAHELMLLQKQFIESYIENRDKIGTDKTALGTWLSEELAHTLPEVSKKDAQQMSDEIISSLTVSQEYKESLQMAVSKGQSKESWFAGVIKKVTAHFSGQQTSEYLQGLDNAVSDANTALRRTITTKAGTISENPNLDGFIAEQYQAQTFNMNAEASGSPYRAKVLEPTGKGYAKNSVDIVIIDESGKIVHKYQSKYCKDAASTAKAFEKGDYRGQQKLVPEGQSSQIGKKATEVIEAPDGTTSNPLSKDAAKSSQEKAQSGQSIDLDWNEFKTKELATHIGVQAGQAALYGAAIGAGMNVVQKVWNGEKIDGMEIAEDAFKSGADFGIKAAAAGALKAGAEKGIVTIIPKGTPAATIANVVHVAVEDIKVLGKVVTGELTFAEGIDQLEQTTVSTVAGIAASAKGAAIGASVGSVLGPIGTAVGGFVGGAIGYMAGSKVGEVATKGVQKIREKTKEIINDFANSMVDRVRYGIFA